MPTPGGPDLNNIGEIKVSKLNQLHMLFERIASHQDVEVIHATAQSGIELIREMMTNNDILLGAIEELESMALDMHTSKRKVDAG